MATQRCGADSEWRNRIYEHGEGNGGTDKSAAETSEQYLTFMLAGEEYGVDILRVQEIKGWDKVTRIPHTPDYVLGVINLRGAVVPILDLRRRFGLETIEFGPTTVVIVVRVGGGHERAHRRRGRRRGIRGLQRRHGGDQAAAGCVRQRRHGIRQGTGNGRGKDAHSARHRPAHRQQHLRRIARRELRRREQEKDSAYRTAGTGEATGSCPARCAHDHRPGRRSCTLLADASRRRRARSPSTAPGSRRSTRRYCSCSPACGAPPLSAAFACSWTGVSDGLRRTANLLGMTDMLHFPQSGLISR